MRTFLFFIAFLLSAYLVQAQTKTVSSEEQVWMGYFNQSRFSKHWGLWAEAQLRTKENFFSQFSTGITRAGLTYYLGDQTKLTAGYAYVWNFPTNTVRVTQPEHRPWQQLQWHTNYARVKTMQWFRLEERFRRKILNDSTLGQGSNFNFRARYNFLLQVPFANRKIQSGDVSFILNNEVHLNFGRIILNNTFDQNRFFAGFAFHTNATDNLQVGYLNVFQQLAGAGSYRMLHAARLYYFHNMDWRK